jgi:Glycosyl hydrolases family 39
MKRSPFLLLFILTASLLACNLQVSTPDQTNTRQAPSIPNEQAVYSNNFDNDTATTIQDGSDSDTDPDYLQLAADPVSTNSNGGAGLRPGQAQTTTDGDGQTPLNRSVQLDVVSDAATAFAGGFSSKALLLHDQHDATSGVSPDNPQFASFSVVTGDLLDTGTLTLDFYDPVGSAGGFIVSLGSAFTSGTDNRITGAARVISITIKDGIITAGGINPDTNVTYTKGTVQTLTIKFSTFDTSKSSNGTVSYQIGTGAIGTAGYSNPTRPNRLAISSEGAANTSGIKLIDNISLVGVEAGEVTSGDPVSVKVNWGNTQYSTSPFAYGMNGYSAVHATVSGQASYGTGMGFMKAGLIRYHYAGLTTTTTTASTVIPAPTGFPATDSRSWVNYNTQSWDATRINTVLNNANNWQAGYAPEKLITIPTWPTWLATYTVTVGTRTVRLLDPSAYAAFAQFCADLVTLVNVTQGRGVKYWEVTNERDDAYYVPWHNAGIASQNKMSELVSIYNLAAAAMKAVDPTIQVGGPAFARADLTPSVRAFVQGAANNIDFLSYHFYANGDLRESDSQIYNRVASLEQHIRDIKQVLTDEIPSRTVPMHLNEYNISFTFTNDDPRMRTNKGAVFDALTMIGSLDTGVTATNAWNEKDGVYGKMDGSSNNVLRLPARTYNLFNAYLNGNRVLTTTGDNKSIVPYAIQDTNPDKRALVMVNRSANKQLPKLLETTAAGWGLRNAASIVLHQISETGYSFAPITYAELISKRFSLPENSVTLLEINRI